MWAASIGISKALATLEGTPFARAFGDSRLGDWLTERVNNYNSGESHIPGPRQVFRSRRVTREETHEQGSRLGDHARDAEGRGEEGRGEEGRGEEGRGEEGGEGAESRTMAERADAIRNSDQVSGDRAALEKMLREAEAGDEGALGELQAIERWLSEGTHVEALPEHQNSGRKNPDYRVNGEIVEVKTRNEPITDRYIKDQITKANKQVKKSGLDDTGAVEIQLNGEAAAGELAAVEAQVHSNFNEARGTSLHRVSVFKDGVLFGEWIRTSDGTVTRTFPQ